MTVADKVKKLQVRSYHHPLSRKNIHREIDWLVARLNRAEIYPNDIHIKIGSLCFDVKFREKDKYGPDRYLVLCCQDKPFIMGPWEHQAVAILEFQNDRS